MQEVIALSLVALSAAYLAWRWWFRKGSKCSEGCCCPSTALKKDLSDSAARAKSTKA